MLAGLVALGAGLVLEVIALMSFSVVCNCPRMRAGDDDDDCVSVTCHCIAGPRLAATLSSAAGFAAIITGAILLAIAAKLKKPKENPS